MQSDQLNRPEEVTAPIIGPGHTYASITDKISAIVLSNRTPRGWWLGLGFLFLLVMVLMYSITWLLVQGVGIWGINVPVGWGFAIINLVWWIGIGHAGTLISAILLLLRQEWRTSINRFAEAMTLFAVACAGIFPLLHVGRPWFAYWLIPFPNTLGMWPQFRSPLAWDVFAISTYATVSALFWYIGLVPDLATLRDRAENPLLRIIFGVFALGWRGAATHWHRYNRTYLILAALATPLVVSVHSVISLDFSVGIVPGWHSTMFPPYFVAGAIFAGFAMVAILAIPVRKIYGLEDFITMRHLNNMALIMLVSGSIVLYAYILEIFMAWYSGNQFEEYMIWNRFNGPYRWVYYSLLVCNGLVPQLFWFSRVRSNLALIFVISVIISVGMWIERFVIVVVSLHRDFLPSSWSMYAGTFWDWSLYIGTIGLFFALLFLFVRLLPVISIFEMRELVAEQEHG